MKQKIIYLAIGLIIGIILGLVFNRLQGPSSTTSQGTSENKNTIAASFYPLYFITKEIVGNMATVSNLTPAGVEPHDYEPTAQDMVRLTTSKLVIVNGGLELWFDKIKNSLTDSGVPVVIVSDGLRSQDFTDENGERIKDPHIWLSPRLLNTVVERITEAIIAIDTTNADYYTARAANLKSRLAVLDKEFKQGLASCQKREFVSAHTAFGYLASAYGLEQIGIVGLSPEAEPSSQDLVEIAKFAKAKNIKYIFFETLTSPKLAETLAREVGAKTLVLNPLEGLTEQEMKASKDYFTEMKNNLTNLRTALQCQ